LKNIKRCRLPTRRDTQDHPQKGGILLSVHCETSGAIMRAKEVVKSTGGEEASCAGESSIDTKTIGHNINR
jgi:hypothetical protein